jgi:hypothetical protein
VYSAIIPDDFPRDNRPLDVPDFSQLDVLQSYLTGEYKQKVISETDGWQTVSNECSTILGAPAGTTAVDDLAKAEQEAADAAAAIMKRDNEDEDADQNGDETGRGFKICERSFPEHDAPLSVDDCEDVSNAPVFKKRKVARQGRKKPGQNNEHDI